MKNEVIVIFEIDGEIKKQAKNKALTENKTLKQYITDLIKKDLRR